MSRSDLFTFECSLKIGTQEQNVTTDVFERRQHFLQVQKIEAHRLLWVMPLKIQNNSIDVTGVVPDLHEDKRAECSPIDVQIRV